MRILIDHCLPRRLAREFPTHRVRTAADQGWERLRNGKLLAAASAEFDVVLTIDKNLRHEQNVVALPIAVIVIMARSNRLADVIPFVSGIEEAMRRLKPNTLTEIAQP